MAKPVAVEIDGKTYIGAYWIKTGEIFFHAFIRESEDDK